MANFKTQNPTGIRLQRTPTFSGRLNLLDLLAFVIPLSQFIEVNAVGRLFGPDLILIAVLPLLLSKRGRLLAAPLPAMALILGIAWLFNQMITDLIRDTSFQDYARGWAKIIFLMINFSSLYLIIIGSKRRIFLYALGLAIGGLVAFKLNPHAFAGSYPWKFGYGSSVSLLLVLAATLFYWRKFSNVIFAVAILMFAALLNVYLGSRSVGGMYLLAGCFVALQYFLTIGGKRQFSLNPVHMAVISLVAVAVVGIVLQVYANAASSGSLGRAAQEKYQAQSALVDEWGVFGLIAGGRNYIFASINAVSDRPVFGHGSWAKDREYVFQFFNTLRQLGMRATEQDLQQTLKKEFIPTHSHFFGAWVEAGIIGALFWLWAMIKIFLALFKLVGKPHPLTPLLAYMGIDMVWTILFSPLGAEGRMTSAAGLAIMLVILVEISSTRANIGRRNAA